MARGNRIESCMHAYIHIYIHTYIHTGNIVNITIKFHTLSDRCFSEETFCWSWCRRLLFYWFSCRFRRLLLALWLWLWCWRRGRFCNVHWSTEWQGRSRWWWRRRRRRRHRRMWFFFFHLTVRPPAVPCCCAVRLNDTAIPIEQLHWQYILDIYLGKIEKNWLLYLFLILAYFLFFWRIS